VKIELMMGSTVLMLRWCSSQMAVLVSPSAMSARTSRSRGLRWSSGSPSGSDDGRGRVARCSRTSAACPQNASRSCSSWRDSSTGLLGDCRAESTADAGDRPNQERRPATQVASDPLRACRSAHIRGRSHNGRPRRRDFQLFDVVAGVLDVFGSGVDVVVGQHSAGGGDAGLRPGHGSSAPGGAGREPALLPVPGSGPPQAQQLRRGAELPGLAPRLTREPLEVAVLVEGARRSRRWHRRERPDHPHVELQRQLRGQAGDTTKIPLAVAPSARRRS